MNELRYIVRVLFYTGALALGSFLLSVSLEAAFGAGHYWKDEIMAPGSGGGAQELVAPFVLLIMGLAPFGIVFGVAFFALGMWGITKRV